MFDLTSKIIKWFTEPISEPLRKSPEMAKAHTEAEILKAEEDFGNLRVRSIRKSSRGSVRLVPRYYPDEEKSPDRKESHIERGPIWDSRTSAVSAPSSRSTKLKKRK